MTVRELIEELLTKDMAAEVVVENDYFTGEDPVDLDLPLRDRSPRKTEGYYSVDGIERLDLVDNADPFPAVVIQNNGLSPSRNK